MDIAGVATVADSAIDCDDTVDAAIACDATGKITAISYVLQLSNNYCSYQLPFAAIGYSLYLSLIYSNYHLHIVAIT